MTNVVKLRRFVQHTTRTVDNHTGDEAELLRRVRPLLADLVAEDDWLPEECAQPHPTRYTQYLLHCDPLERLCVISCVWGPGQASPIHDHTVWGLVGMLRGAELSTRYDRQADGRLEGHPVERLEPGAVDAVSPAIGDIHAISNAHSDRVSISIHVYGGNTSAIERSIFDPDTGARRPVFSSYANAAVPNFWDRSRSAA